LRVIKRIGGKRLRKTENPWKKAFSEKKATQDRAKKKEAASLSVFSSKPIPIVR
jgi:hypothetical protein